MRKIGRIQNINKCLFIQIDIQEVFRKLTYKFDNLALIGKIMMESSKIMKNPIIIT